jgi:hypothetical protein
MLSQCTDQGHNSGGGLPTLTATKKPSAKTAALGSALSPWQVMIL